MSLEFKYKPITAPDGIRLIELQPSLDPSTELRCSLIHTSLSSCDIHDLFGHYTALSYVWGSNQMTKTIWVDGTPLKITSNLFSALHDLRDETRNHFLWADAICINQGNNEERTTQVGIMGKIYATAFQTILYLGPAHPDSDECRCLAAIRQNLCPIEAEMDQLLDSVFSKEWFTRVWVFQELVFSINPWLQCGKTRVMWSRVYSFLTTKLDSLLVSAQGQRYKIVSEMQTAKELHHGYGKAVPYPDPYSGITKWQATWEEHDRWYGEARNSVIKHHYERLPSNSIGELLQARRGMGVSDWRDMIFAHVGFASDVQHKDLQVDYSKDYKLVYKDFARYLAKYYGFATLLEYAGEGKSPTHRKNLPSWVPDWTSSITAKRFPMQYRFYFEEMRLEWMEEQEIPACGPLYYDTILFVSSELSMGKISNNTRQVIASRLVNIKLSLNGVDQIIIDSKDTGILKEVWPEVYQIWREVISDDKILAADLGELSTKFSDNFFYDTASVPLYLILAFHNSLALDYLNGRVLAKMSSGKLALVPSSTQEGDIIAPILDHSWRGKEFVFRPLQCNDTCPDVDAEVLKSLEVVDGLVVHCKLIGECRRDGFEESSSRWADKYKDNVSKPLIIVLY